MQHDNFDEEDSLHRIEQGDEVAARELLRQFHPFVLKLVRAHLPRRISEEIAAGIEKLAATEVDTATTDDFDLAKKLVTELIAQLSPEDRLVITLLHLEEKSVEEIHALTGWSRSATKVRAFRARAKMKKMLNERETLAFA